MNLVIPGLAGSQEALVILLYPTSNNLDYLYAGNAWLVTCVLASELWSSCWMACVLSYCAISSMHNTLQCILQLCILKELQHWFPVTVARNSYMIWGLRIIAMHSLRLRKPEVGRKGVPRDTWASLPCVFQPLESVFSA